MIKRDSQTLKVPVNVAVIGAGVWGANHVRIYKTLEKLKLAQLAAVCDNDPRVRRHLDETYGLKVVANYQDLLADRELDAVSICTPNATHAKIAEDCLKAGKNVLIEKPMALSSKEGERLVRLAESASLVLMVGHVFRFNPVVRRLKNEIEKGTFGHIYSVMANRTNLFMPRPDCGIIFDQAIHDVDILLYLFDEMMPRRVFCAGRAFLGTRFEEAVLLALDFEHFSGYVFASLLLPNKVREAWLSGSERCARVDYLSQKLEVFDRTIKVNGSSSLEIKDGPAHEVSVNREEALKVELSEFVECVREHRRPEADGYVGLRAVRICEAALESAREGQVEILSK